VIIYVTDKLGKTHGYDMDRYSLATEAGKDEVRITKTGFGLIAVFYSPVCWFMADPKELGK